MEKIFAQSRTNLGTIGGAGLGPFSNPGQDPVSALRNFTQIISSIIGVMTVAAGIWFMFNLLIGAIQWISAGGDKNTLQQAQQRILNAFLGLLIVVAGWTILALASRFLGLDLLIVDPSSIINNLSPGGGGGGSVIPAEL